MKLSKTDLKIILYLYNNCRDSYTKIAKECGLSRKQVEYGIKKYEKNGLIKKYLTIFNYNYLGFNQFVTVWMKIKKDKDTIKKELSSMKNVLSTGDVITQYNLFVNFICEDMKKFEKIYYNFLDKHKENIDKYEIFLVSSFDLFPLKILKIEYEQKKVKFMGEKNNKIELTEQDLRILRELEKNARIPLIDIAKKTNISCELIHYKLKQYHKNNLISGTRIQFNLEKLKLNGALYVMKINKSESLIEKIQVFCKNHSYINGLSLGISEYNCFIQIFYENDEELRKTIKDINKKFDAQIKKSKLLLLENEEVANTLPL